LKKLTLNELRQTSNKTQEDLANIIGKTTSAYNMIENGKRKLSLDDAAKIATFYQISIEEINFFKEKNNTALKGQ
jgi:DNA-binding XRE family transcriptional regulator